MTQQQLDALFSVPIISPPMNVGSALRCVSRPTDCVDHNPPPVEVKQACSLHPKNVIFNPPATIVEWTDGTKTVVKCHDDEFSEEFGYAMAVMRKIYGSRKDFLAQFKNAYRPYLKPKKVKKAKHKAEGQTDDGAQS